MPSRRFTILVCILFLFSLQIPALYSDTLLEKVRICLYEEKNFFEIDASGNKSGYAYEFLQEISKYTNWQYEYTPFTGTWETQLTKLKNGSIDILTRGISAVSFDESAFILSDSPLLITSSVLATNPQNAPLWKNPAAQKKLIIGMVKNSYYENQVREFCSEKGITSEFLYFNDNTELQNALHKTNTVQAIFTLKSFESSQELIITEFEPYKMYFMIHNKNTHILSDLNKAMALIDRYSTAVRSTLNRKYMESGDKSGNFSLTLDEFFFIDEFKKTNKKISAIMTPLREPLSYFEEDEPRGIAYDIVASAVKPLGLEFSLIETNTHNEYLNTISVQKPAIILTKGKDLSWAEQEGYRFTDPYITLNYSSLRLKDHTPEVSKAAAVTAPLILENYMKKHFEEDQIIMYNTIEECVTALVNKEAGVVFLDSYTAKYYLERDYKRQFQEEAIPGLQLDLCIAVNNSIDARVFSILNKAVRSISAESLFDTIYTYTHTHPENGEINLSKLAYTRPLQFIIVILAPVLLIILFSLHLYSIRTQKKVVRAMDEKSQFGSVLCSFFDTVCEWDIDENIIQYFFFMENRLVKQRDYFTVSEYIDHAKKHILHPEDVSGFTDLFNFESLEKLLKTPRTLYKEFRLLTPGSINKSGYEWNAITLQAFSSSQSARKFIVCTKNIDDVKHSEVQKNEQLKEALIMAEKANKSKSDFLSRMSHEIRTPLNAILGFITLAKRTIHDTAKAVDYISKSEYASKHLLSLINDILDMSAIESGKMKINDAEFELKTFISSLSATFYGQAKLKNIRFSTIITNVTEEYLCGDQVRLNQILMNILSNAIKFTPMNGEVSLTITQKLLLQNTVYMQFSVADTGIGMSPEFLHKIGKPFEQENSMIAREYGGSGLGISISKNLIQAMKGTLNITSEENKGSLFTIELPLGLVEKRADAAAPLYNGKTVLLITMDKELGEYEKKLFRNCGVEAEVGLSIEDVTRHAASDHQPCAVCIIDIDRLKDNPLSFIQEVQKIIPKETPIALLSYDFSPLEEKGREMQIRHFIQKPLFQSTVVNLLLALFENFKIEDDFSTRYSFSGKHILLAEDNDFNREIAVDILSTQGFIVDTVRNGKEAVDAFNKSAQNFYDLILLDIQMPVLNGHDACRQIRSLERKDAKQIPVIAMTANAFAEDVAAALSSGMNDHIAKPIDTRTLFSVLQRYIPG